MQVKYLFSLSFNRPFRQVLLVEQYSCVFTMHWNHQEKKLNLREAVAWSCSAKIKKNIFVMVSFWIKFQPVNLYLLFKRDVSRFSYRFDSAQVKWYLITCTKSIIYKLPHELPIIWKISQLGGDRVSCPISFSELFSEQILWSNFSWFLDIVSLILSAIVGASILKLNLRIFLTKLCCRHAVGCF